MHLHRYYDTLCREIDDLIRIETDCMTASGEKLLHALLENKKHVCEMLKEHKPSEEVSEYGKLLEDVADELSSAEEYYGLWESTGDANYKAMCKDELKHAEYLMRTIGTKEGTAHEKAKLQEHTTRYAELMRRP